MKTSIKNVSYLLIYLFIYLNNLLSAQPFHGQLYYRHDSVYLSSSCRTFNNPGYLMGGYRPISSNTTQCHFILDKVDGDGTFGGASEFSNEYYVLDSNSTGCAGGYHQKYFYGVTAIETNNLGQGEVYAIAGAHRTGVFFATLDQFGNVIQTYRWQLPFPSTYQAYGKRPHLYESVANPGKYFICGDYERMAYVFCVDATGAGPYSTAVWSNFYNNNNWLEGHALIESPYNPNELVVVGRTDMSTLPNRAADAFFLNLNAGTGAVLNYTTYNGSYDGDDWLDCIQPASSVNGGNDGYIVGGRSHHLYKIGTILSPTVIGSSFDHACWMAKLSQTGAITWSKLIKQNYSTSGNLAGSINSVFERQNTTGSQPVYEYYGAFQSNDLPGGVTAQNLAVVKLDQNGNDGTYNPDEFHYNFGEAHDGFFGQAYSAAYLTNINTNGTDDGLQAFGTCTTVSGGFYFSKGYFNGVSGCNEDITNIDSLARGPDSVATEIIDVIPINTNCQPSFQLVKKTLSTTASTLCFSNTGVTGGSNLRFNSMLSVADHTNYGQIVSVSPNPAQNLLQVKFQSLPPGVYTVKLIDLLGKIQLCMDFTQLEQKTSESYEEININALQSGSYILKVTGNDFSTSHRIVVLH